MGYEGLSEKLRNHHINQEFSSVDRIEIYNAFDQLSQSEKNARKQEFSNLTKDLFEKDRETTNRVYDIIENRQTNIAKQLERNDLTPAQRDKLNEDDNELVRIAVAKDTETKEFRMSAMKLTQWVSLGIQLGVIILPHLLASNGEITDGAESAIKLIPKK